MIAGKNPFPFPKGDVYLYLCFQYSSQQLSTKVADIIRKRFLKLYPGKPVLRKSSQHPMKHSGQSVYREPKPIMCTTWQDSHGIWHGL